MKRRVIKQGRETLTVTLPIKWARAHGIHGGTEIEVEEGSDRLTLLPGQHIRKKHHATIDITGMSVPVIWKYFMAVYREGYDEIIIKFDPALRLENLYKYFTRHALDKRYGSSEGATAQERIGSMMSRFIGFEVIEQGRDFCLIHYMAETTENELDSSLRRIFLLIQQMADEIAHASATDDYDLLEHMHDVDINVDKFVDYCIRVLNKISFKVPRKVPLLFSTIYILELVGDEFKHAANDILAMHGRSLKHVSSVSKIIAEQARDYYNLYYKFSLDLVQKIHDDDLKMHDREMLPKLYKISTEMEKEVFTHLRRISRYINALVELRIQMEF